MKPKTTKNKEGQFRPVNLEFHPEDYVKLKSLAERETRSLRNYLMVVILKHLYAQEGASQTPQKPSGN